MAPVVPDAPTQQNDSEARFRLLLGNIAQAFWETDPDGVVVVDSPSWRAYTGQSVDEWMGYGWLGAIHPDDRAFAERQWRASVAARRLVDAEFRLQAPDGGWRWTNVRAAPMLDADGRIARWLGMNIDIDARKRVEAALRESEARFRTLADTAPALIWFNDPDGNNIFVNQVCLDYTGRSQAEIAGSGWRDLLDPQLEAAYTAGYLAATRERREWRDRTRIRRWDGAWHWFENHARPMVSDDGSYLGHVGVSVDVNEVAEAEVALRTSEARQQVLIEGVPQLVWRAVDHGRWTWASPQWTAKTGQAEADSHDFGWLDKVHPEDRPVAIKAWAGAIDGAEFHANYRLCHPAEGRYRWYQTRATPVRDDRGDIVEWLGTSTDVDDLRRLQKRQEVLLAELQHRTRNILAVTRSIISRSDDGERSTEDYVAHLQGRLAALARTQVLLTRAAGEEVDLEGLIWDELLAQAVSEDQISAAGQPVAISPKCAEVLTLAIHELATNATKYGAFSRASGRLDVGWSIETRDNRDWVVILWKERGVPVIDAFPRRQGFGLELITRRIPYELRGHGTLELKPGGIESRIEFPLGSGESILQTDAGSH